MNIDQPRSILSIWKSSASLYFKALLALLPFTLFIEILKQLLMFEQTTFRDTSNYSIIALMLISGILLVLINVWIIGVVTLQVNSIIQQKHESYKKSMQFAWKKYFVLLALTILSTLIAIGGTMLLIIPGIFLIIILPFANCFVLFEEAKVWPSIKSSFKLVWGNWWRTFVAVYLPLVLLIIIVLLLELLGGFSEDQMKNIDGYIVNPLLGIFLIPFFEVTLINQYYDLKARKLARHS